MVNPSNLESNKQSSPSKTKHVSLGHATLAECARLTGGNTYIAIVFQKLCHYCSKPRFPISGHMYAAPTTKMLASELGLAEATVNKAIKRLKEIGIIETLIRRFNRSPRRYVRVLQYPVTLSGCEGESTGTDPATDVATSTGAEVAPSPTDTVLTKTKKKKNTQNSEQALHQGWLVLESRAGSQKVARGRPIPGESKAGPRVLRDLWEPKDILEQGELYRVRDDALRHTRLFSRILTERAGWDNERYIRWQNDFTSRCIREYRCKRSKLGTLDCFPPPKSLISWPGRLW